MPDWLIEKLVPGGAGMARLPDGRVGFAAGALPGDRIAVSALREHKSHVEAERFSLVTESTERVAAPCPVARECGGCDWMALPIEAQRRYKLELLEQALRRTGGLRDLPPLTLEHAGSDQGYRNRVRFQIDEQGSVGFFARGSRRLVVIPSCAVAEPALNEALQALRAIAAQHSAALGRFASAEIRVASEPPRNGLRLEPRAAGEAPSAAVQALLLALKQQFAVVVGQTPGAPEQRLPLGSELTMSVPVGAFSQVNWSVNQRLIQDVLTGARARSANAFCDLYAGAGNFSLPLLAAGLRGVSVEAHAGSLRAAERSAQAQGLTGEFVADDVGRALQRMHRRGQSFELCVLDPPRAGARDVLESLLAVASKTIAYVACDPVTLARDVKWLVARGFALRAVTAYDMFPHTHHFETLAWLERA